MTKNRSCSKSYYVYKLYTIEKKSIYCVIYPTEEYEVM